MNKFINARHIVTVVTTVYEWGFKLEVPIFDGNILHLKQFWEQFHLSVHGTSALTDAEKLVYLHQALKDDSAKSAIEGLSRSGKHYSESIECLKSGYDCPHLIHLTHVRLILKAPPLKKGTEIEWCFLHDVSLCIKV